MTGLNLNLVFEASEIAFAYPGKIEALSGVSFDIHTGEIVALVGANGSGKSTLLKLMDGLAFPGSGELRAFGKPLSERSFHDALFNRDFRRRVGFVFQDPDVQLFSATVWDEVTFGPLQLGLPREEVINRAESTLQLLDISHLKKRPPYLLSGGEKKKVSLASVLSLQPEVLLLDEPTSGLDPRSQGNLIDFLLGWAGKGKTVIFSTQDLDLVEEVAGRLIVLGSDHHIVVDGEPAAYLTDPDFLLRTNLVHEHSHRHKGLVHRHSHLHEHRHDHADKLPAES